MRYGGRAHAIILSTVTLGAVLSPLVRDPPIDDFPLSNYPMFSRAPETTVVSIDHVVGWSRDGQHRPIEPGLVDTEEVMQALQTIHVAVQRGPAAAADLCRRAASRVREDDDYGDIEVLEVRTDTYDVLRYFADGPRPMATRVVARCDVATGDPR